MISLLSCLKVIISSCTVQKCNKNVHVYPSKRALSDFFGNEDGYRATGPPP